MWKWAVTALLLRKVKIYISSVSTFFKFWTWEIVFHHQNDLKWDKKPWEKSVKSSKKMLDVWALPLPASRSLKLVINNVLSTKCTHMAPHPVITEHLTISYCHYFTAPTWERKVLPPCFADEKNEAQKDMRENFSAPTRNDCKLDIWDGVSLAGCVCLKPNT